MKKLILAMFAACISSQAFAVGQVTAKVLSVRVDQTGNAIVRFEQTVGGTPPGCVTGTYTNAFAFNTNTAGGKAVLALVLSAKAMGSTVTANGLGSCYIFGSSVEDWDTGTAQ